MIDHRVSAFLAASVLIQRYNAVHAMLDSYTYRQFSALQLHWLLVLPQRVEFEVTIPATLIHQALSGYAASYVADDCCLITNAPPRSLDCARLRFVHISSVRSGLTSATEQLDLEFGTIDLSADRPQTAGLII